MQIPFTQQQYAAALAALKAAKGVVVTPTSDGGIISTPQVNFSYGYDGITLSVIITAKHGLAKFASDDTVYSKITELLQKE